MQLDLSSLKSCGSVSDSSNLNHFNHGRVTIFWGETASSCDKYRKLLQAGKQWWPDLHDVQWNVLCAFDPASSEVQIQYIAMLNWTELNNISPLNWNWTTFTHQRKSKGWIFSTLDLFWQDFNTTTCYDFQWGGDCTNRNRKHHMAAKCLNWLWRILISLLWLWDFIFF